MKDKLVNLPRVVKMDLHKFLGDHLHCEEAPQEEDLEKARMLQEIQEQIQKTDVLKREFEKKYYSTENESLVSRTNTSSWCVCAF